MSIRQHGAATGSNFGSSEITTTGGIASNSVNGWWRVGLVANSGVLVSAASVGDGRLKNIASILFRNLADDGNIGGISHAGVTLTVGGGANGSTAPTMVVIDAFTTGELKIGFTAVVTWTNTTCTIARRLLVTDSASPTKAFDFDASGITAGNTRTIAIPDNDAALIDAFDATLSAQVFS